MPEQLPKKQKPNRLWTIVAISLAVALALTLAYIYASVYLREGPKGNPAGISSDQSISAETQFQSKFIRHAEPEEIPIIEFSTEDGTQKTFQDFEGELLLVNFWATWCAPCRREMKQLDNKNTLWKEFNGRAPDFAEIQLNTQAAEIDRKMCAAFPMVPVINFENQNLVHCSKKFANNAITSKEFKITQENIDKMMNFRLFKYENYCKTCTEFVQPKGHFPLKKYASILNEATRKAQYSRAMMFNVNFLFLIFLFIYLLLKGCE